MDKSIYIKKKSYKLFGKTFWEKSEMYEGVDLENVEPINPLILTDLSEKLKEENRGE